MLFIHWNKLCAVNGPGGDSAQKNPSLLKTYGPFLNSLLGSEFSGDSASIQDDGVDSVLLASYRVSDAVEVFGWHPHWMEDAFELYNYKLISTLAFFSYDVDVPYKIKENSYSLTVIDTANRTEYTNDLEGWAIRDFTEVPISIKKDTTYDTFKLATLVMDTVSKGSSGKRGQKLLKGNIILYREWDGEQFIDHLRMIVKDTINIREDGKPNYLRIEIDARKNNVRNGGGYKDVEAINQWKTSPWLDTVKANGCKLFLTVTNYGSRNNSVFLDDRIMQETLIDSLRALLLLRNADGVDIDFEAVPKKYSKKFTDFIQLLTKSLREDNPDYLVYVDLPAEDGAKVFDVKRLQRFANSFVMMGYDYHGPGSGPGPISPLYSDEGRSSLNGLDIGRSVASYLDRGILSRNLILALPFYGGRWKYDLDLSKDPVQSIEGMTYDEINSAFKDKPYKFDGHRTYSQIRAELEPVEGWANKDENTSSRNAIYVHQGKTLYNIWYDDTTTLGHKYRWAMQLGLKGVGFWALGYGDGNGGDIAASSSLLWLNIANNFAEGMVDESRPPVSLLDFVLEYQQVIVVNLLVLLTFMVAGFVFSLFNWKVREVLFSHKTFRLLYICLFFLLAVLVISVIDLEGSRNFIFGLGLLLGLGISYWVFLSTEHYRHRYPKS